MLEPPMINGLAIIFRNDDKDIAAVCYRDSNYPREAIEKLRELVNGMHLVGIQGEIDAENIKCNLVSFVTRRGGGICKGFYSDVGWRESRVEFPLESAKEVFPNSEHGLVATTDRGIWDIYRACHGQIYINLDRNNAINETVLWYNGLSEFINDFDRWADEKDVLELPFDPELFSLDELESIHDFITENTGDLFKDGEGGFTYWGEGW